MRVLVYGAGVIGCELAHVLCQNGNEVVLLARGEWKKTIEKNGLTVKHCGYLHTTVDTVRVIEELKEEDSYDLIFVVMTYQNIKNIVPILKRNVSRTIVFVGNNAAPARLEEELNKDILVHKTILFGFTGMGGERKKDKILSMHPLKITLRIGSRKDLPETTVKDKVETIFANTECALKWEKNMDTWLLTHLASVLPTTYLCYNKNFQLYRISKQEKTMMLEAVEEAYDMLEDLGYLTEEDKRTRYVLDRKKQMKKLFFLFQTPAGKFVVSNHCAHGVKEMMQLDETFDIMRKKSKVPMPHWEQLRNLRQPAKEIYL